MANKEIVHYTKSDGTPFIVERIAVTDDDKWGVATAPIETGDGTFFREPQHEGTLGSCKRYVNRIKSRGTRAIDSRERKFLTTYWVNGQRVHEFEFDSMWNPTGTVLVYPERHED